MIFVFINSTEQIRFDRFVCRCWTIRTTSTIESSSLDGATLLMAVVNRNGSRNWKRPSSHPMDSTELVNKLPDTVRSTVENSFAPIHRQDATAQYKSIDYQSKWFFLIFFFGKNVERRWRSIELLRRLSRSMVHHRNGSQRQSRRKQLQRRQSPAKRLPSYPRTTEFHL